MKPHRIIAVTVLLIGLCLLIGGQITFAADQTSAPAPAEASPAATVEVQMDDAAGGESTESGHPVPKVQIQMKNGKAAPATTAEEKPVDILPSPEQPIAPVNTEVIDQAGKKVGETIDEITIVSSYRVGQWIRAEAFYGITWLKLSVTLVVILLIAGVERLAVRFIRWRLHRLTLNGKQRPWTKIFLRASQGPLSVFVLVYGAYFALSPLFVHFNNPFGANSLHDSARWCADMAGGIAVIWFVYRFILEIDHYLEILAESPTSKVDGLMASILGKTIRIIVVVTGAVLIIQKLTGIAAAPMIASLGIGGLAVALAAKEPLTNLISTFIILFDKPFRVGQRIILQGYDGMVESVGYRSTKVRTWDGYLVSIPNQTVLSANLENVALRPHIQWSTSVAVPFDTPSHKVDRAVEIIREILHNHEGMSDSWPPWVYLNGFNEWSFNIMIWAWYSPPDLRLYYHWLERTCLEIVRRFEQEGIRFAIPPAAVHLPGLDAKEPVLRMLRGADQPAVPEVRDAV